MLSGWRRRAAQAVVVDPSPAAAALARPGRDCRARATAIPAGFRPGAVVLAVKPQVAPAAVPGLQPFVADALVVSIMAGRTVAWLRDQLGGAAIVRAMPNTPAAIGEGFTAAFAGPGVSDAQRGLCDTMLTAIGEVAWVDAGGADRRRHRHLRRWPGLRVPVGRIAGGGGGRARLAHRPGPAAGPAHRCRVRRVAGRQHDEPAAMRQRRHQPGRHHRTGAGRADGAGRLARRDVPRHRRSHRPVARVVVLTAFMP